MMEDLLDLIQAEGVLLGDYVTAFTEALGYLQEKGNSADRTNTANWFNWAAGYDEF